MEVIGKNRCLIATLERMVSQQDRKGSSSFKTFDFSDYLLQGYGIAE